MDPFPQTVTIKNGQSLVVDIARPEELDEICEFLRQHYFTTSPMCCIVKECPTKSNIETFIVRSLKKPISLVVRDANRKMVAIQLNELEMRYGPSLEANLLFSKGEKSILSSMVQTLRRDFDIFEKFHADRIFCFVILAVDQNYSRLELGSILVTMSIKLALFYGVGAMCVYTFNEYEADIAKQHGFETDSSINYANFKFNGEYPLACKKNLLAEHPTARCMVRNLIVWRKASVKPVVKMSTKDINSKEEIKDE